MKPRRQPIARRTPLRQGKPLERGGQLRRTPINRVAPTPKRTAHGPVKARLESSEIPRPIRLAVYARDGWTCQRCGIYIPDSGRRWGLQHRRPRKAGGSRLLHTMPNLVLVCGWSVDPGTCTEWMEVEDRPAATRLGWLVPNGAAPEEWPVYRWTPDGHQWMQPGDEWVEAVPHPRQVEMGSAA